MRTPTFPAVAVVGMHFRQEVDAKGIVESFVPPVDLDLEREPDNQYDAFAIKVLYAGAHIGYVEAKQACFIAPWMDEGNTFHCTVESLETRRNNLHPICAIAPVE